MHMEYIGFQSPQPAKNPEIKPIPLVTKAYQIYVAPLQSVLTKLARETPNNMDLMPKRHLRFRKP